LHQDLQENVVESKAAGTYYAVVALHGNYTGQIKIKYVILPEALANLQIKVPEYAYIGKQIIPEMKDIEVLLNGRSLSLEEKEGLVVKSAIGNVNITDAAIVTIEGTGNFAGEVECPFSITAKSLQDEGIDITFVGQDIAGTDTRYETEWDGIAKTPEVEIKNNDTRLVEGRDYTVVYRYNNQIGTARVIVTGLGNYCDSCTLYFEITGTKLAENNGVQISIEEDTYYYTGQKITPEIEIRRNGEKLQNGVDYNAFYSNNVNAGTAKVTIIGAGEYTGSIVKNFTILPKTLEQAEEIKTSSIPKQRYTRSAIVPDVAVEIDGYKLIKEKDYTVTAKNAIEAGIATLIVTGKGNYGGVLAEVDFQIYKTTIKYVLNGGKNSPDNPDYYTAADRVILAEPTKESYLFVGWYSDKACTKKVTGIEPGTNGNKTFYAKWTPKEVRGIDVSKWQGNIDWNAVKKSGVKFAIIRAGNRYGSSGEIVEDPYFAYNFKSALGAGLKVGVYFYSQAINESEAIDEANKTLSLIKKYRAEFEAETGKKADLTYPIFIDTEYLGGGRADSLTAAARTACVKAFCKKVEATGYEAGVYANKDWFMYNLYAGELNDYCIWVAQYPKNYTEGMKSTYTGPHRIWQYTSSGIVSGISGRVDMNICYQDFVRD